MRRPFLSFVVAALACSAAVVSVRAQVPAASPQAVDDLVAKNLQARGGIEKIKSVQTIKQIAHLSSQGLEITMTLYGKRPNMTRKELAVGPQTVLYVFDGTMAWTLNPLAGSSDPLVVTGPDVDMIRQESEFDSPFVDYKARGYAIELVGTETVGNRKMQHLKVTGKNRATQDCYLDTETGLEARTVNQSPMGALEQEFSDYRDVQGLKMPFSVRTLQNGASVAQLAVEKIEINGAIDDALFKKPTSR
jgi:outer membrane lipoprotein-sorting protein